MNIACKSCMLDQVLTQSGVDSDPTSAQINGQTVYVMRLH